MSKIMTVVLTYGNISDVEGVNDTNGRVRFINLAEIVDQSLSYSWLIWEKIRGNGAIFDKIYIHLEPGFEDNYEKLDVLDACLKFAFRLIRDHSRICLVSYGCDKDMIKLIRKDGCTYVSCPYDASIALQELVKRILSEAGTKQ